MNRSSASSLMALAFSATVLFIVLVGPVADSLLDPPPAEPSRPVAATVSAYPAPVVDESAAPEPMPSTF